jgi:hypothetical protein
MENKYGIKSVFDFVYTTQECAELINAIEHAIESKYDSKLKVMEALSEHAAYVVYKELEQLMSDLGVSVDSKQKAVDFLNQILVDLKSAPVLNLTLAFFPEYSQIKAFTNWWRKNINPKSLIRIKVNHKILAGAVIEWQEEAIPLTLQNAIDKNLISV